MERAILLGTTNQAKARVVQAALDALGLSIKVVTLGDLGIRIAVREDGKTTEENAKKKARAYFAESHIATLAIDGGLHIAKLPEEKQPGVLVRRIHGAERDATDEEILQHYIRELDTIGGESVATWDGSIALVTRSGEVLSETFSFETILTSKRKGCVSAGSPLDALMIDPGSGKYYSEIAWDERPDTRWVSEFLKRNIGEL